MVNQNTGQQINKFPPKKYEDTKKSQQNLGYRNNSNFVTALIKSYK